MAHLTRTVRRLGFFQIDSVNVLQRAHFMPLYSRCGPYDTALLARAAECPPRRVFEYWAHVATYVDIDLWPAMRHRMIERHGMWSSMREVAQEHPGLVRTVRDLVRDHGPITAREADALLHGGNVGRDRSRWGWNWSATKKALEYLFFVGEITAARRNGAFERVYDLTERVIPADVLARPDLDVHEAHRHLVAHAARALGVATEPCLRDYFRTASAPTRRAVAELVEDGVLVPAAIEGWNRPAYLHAEARQPRRIEVRTLLSPFDPLIFERTRTERLFGFRYRIEIYVPEAEREYGYYVLPFLLGDQIVARVDLKADRTSGVLNVVGAWSQADAPEDVAEHLAAELRVLGGWLDLSDIRPPARGDVAPALAKALGET
ncbi:winged helix-turn-helix domain-containing protein [uncultured Aeromicrobium sp.]|uniref:winged helix-turn-helix domain-containing protein n=1 Tax=uncultured Aeromicrobium sp. TaxID=337820 RepID=UPI0025E3B174|nr:crosslink repair DNA glycosylase YcaQ family protein [uncultured Aeromicrobium sp.]